MARIVSYRKGATAKKRRMSGLSAPVVSDSGLIRKRRKARTFAPTRRVMKSRHR